MSATSAAASELRSILRASETGTDDRWRAWSQELMQPHRLSSDLLTTVWEEILEFDPVLADYIAAPLDVPDGAVIVAGSGKETFKTFNVSTAASVLAASDGVPVIKGVSRSVSAVSGAADVLDALGIPTVSHPKAIPEAVTADGVAFTSYAAFCPSYADRYDGVFTALSPLSFFMPVAVLGVSASRFLYGIAHHDVDLATETLRRVRPWLHTGFVVSTEITPTEIMDEWINVGITRTATVHQGEVELAQVAQHASPRTTWRRAVTHHNSHAANAGAVADAVSPTGNNARTDLAEHNAALILRAHDTRISAEEALTRIRQTRLSGRAEQLLARLQERKDIRSDVQRAHPGGSTTANS